MAVAPDEVFTIRMCEDTSQLYETGLARRSAHDNLQATGRRTTRGPGRRTCHKSGESSNGTQESMLNDRETRDELSGAAFCVSICSATLTARGDPHAALVRASWPPVNCTWGLGPR